MRTKFILSSLLLCFSSISLATEWLNKPVMCNYPDIIHKAIKEYNEIPLVGGVTALPEFGTGEIVSNASLVIYVNAKSGSFTVVEYLNRKTACIISIGNNLNYNSKEILEKRDNWINNSDSNLI